MDFKTFLTALAASILTVISFMVYTYIKDSYNWWKHRREEKQRKDDEQDERIYGLEKSRR